MTAFKERTDPAIVGKMDWRGVKVEAGREKATPEVQGVDGGCGSGVKDASEAHV